MTKINNFSQLKFIIELQESKKCKAKFVYILKNDEKPGYIPWAAGPTGSKPGKTCIATQGTSWGVFTCLDQPPSPRRSGRGVK